MGSSAHLQVCGGVSLVSPAVLISLRLPAIEYINLVRRAVSTRLADMTATASGSDDCVPGVDSFILSQIQSFAENFLSVGLQHGAYTVGENVTPQACARPSLSSLQLRRFV